MSKRLMMLVVLSALLLLTAAFQQTPPILPTDNPPNPNANIVFPPPVYLVSGEVTIYGTVNLPNFSSYFVEYRPLAEDLTAPEDAVPWSPAFLPRRNAVVEDVLGVWDTTLTDDGLYQLRLTVTADGTPQVFDFVSPIRVSNTPVPFAPTDTAPQQPTLIVIPSVTPSFDQPTSTPQPTTPQATAGSLDVNVRSGDSVNYPIVGALESGESAPIIGISNTGSGWYLIRLPNGRQGYVSPNVVTVSGDISGLPRVSPPPVPATATPIPTATPSLPDLTIGNVRFDRNIVQGQAFQTIVTVVNNSPVAITQPISVACNFRPMSTFVSSTLSGLGAFSQVDVAITTQLNTGGGGNITAECAVDVNNNIAETNEGNNFFNLTSVLATPVP